MTYNINIVSHISNKSYTIIDTDGNFITQNVSNTMINIPHNTSYIVYIEPYVEELGYTSLLELSTNFLSGIFGYIFIIIIGILFYYLIKMVKQYV